jgi:hypothetical protein
MATNTYSDAWSSVYPGGNLVLSGSGASLTFNSPQSVRDFMNNSQAGNPPSAPFYITGVNGPAYNMPVMPFDQPYALAGIAVQIVSAILNIDYSVHQAATCPGSSFSSLADLVLVCDEFGAEYTGQTLADIRNLLMARLFNPANTEAEAKDARALADTINNSYDECVPRPQSMCFALPQVL